MNTPTYDLSALDPIELESLADRMVTASIQESTCAGISTGWEIGSPHMGTWHGLDAQSYYDLAHDLKEIARDATHALYLATLPPF